MFYWGFLAGCLACVVGVAVSSFVLKKRSERKNKKGIKKDADKKEEENRDRLD